MPRTSFDELKSTGRLPSATGVAMEILRLTQSEDTSASDIADVLRADPALTGRILQLANSAVGGSRHPTTTVNEATVRLGLRTIRNVSLGFALISSNSSGSCHRFDYTGYWARCLARAVTLQSFSWRFRIGVPAETFVLGLLSDIGSLALATVHPTPYSELLAEAEEPEQRARLELDRFGIDHRMVSRCLLEEWGLAHFVDALDSAGFDETAEGKPSLGEMLEIAECFARAFHAGRAQPDQLEQVQQTLRRIAQWNPEDLPEVWNELATEWRRWGSMLDVETGFVPEFGATETGDEVPEEPRGPRHVTVPELKSLRILAIDDEAISLKLLSRHLSKAGHQVTTAQDGEEGLRLALAENPQIVIADWMMPKMTGLELCSALRNYEAGREMYFILLTGQGEDDQIVEAFEEGVDDYIVKPFRPRILMARVRAGRRVIQLQQQVAADKQAMQEQVSQLGVLNRKLEKSSLTDPLTELPNRRAAMEELKRCWEFAERHGTPLSVVMIDIDHFKSFNDTYGHDVGDLVLVETAQVLQECMRQSDMVCRLGGEEFLAIIPDCDHEGAVNCAERLRASLAAHTIDSAEFSGHVTASFGLAGRHPGLGDVDALLKAADEALYVAKEGGRNRVAVSGEPITS